MRKVILIFIVLYSSSVFAQHDPLFTQYYSNDMVLNPAISGSKTYNPFIIQTRQQWLGFEGAPLSTYISYHGALDNSSAMGGYFMYDKAHDAVVGSVHLNYAYHVPLDYEKVNLSFGLGAKFMNYNVDKLDAADTDGEPDDAFPEKSYNKQLGDASSGVYLYGRNFYAGFSASNLFQSSFYDPVDDDFPNTLVRNYYSMGAYRFHIMNKDWQFESSFLLRKAQNSPTITDLTARILYLENTWSGLTYRTDGTAVIAFGLAAGNIHFSYSYDHSFSGEIQQETLGTHEIGISFRIETVATNRAF